TAQQQAAATPPPDLPPECKGLGPFLAEHKGGSKHHTKLAFVYPIALLVITVPFECWAIAALIGHHTDKEFRGALAFSIVGGIFICLFLAGIIVGIRRTRRRVLVFRDGLVSVRREQAKSCRWEDVTLLEGGTKETYYNNALIDKTCHYTLIL